VTSVVVTRLGVGLIVFVEGFRVTAQAPESDFFAEAHVFDSRVDFKALVTQ